MSSEKYSNFVNVSKKYITTAFVLSQLGGCNMYNTKQGASELPREHVRTIVTKNIEPCFQEQNGLESCLGGVVSQNIIDYDPYMSESKENEIFGVVEKCIQKGQENYTACVVKNTEETKNIFEHVGDAIGAVKDAVVETCTHNAWAKGACLLGAAGGTYFGYNSLGDGGKKVVKKITKTAASGPSAVTPSVPTTIPSGPSAVTP